MGIMETPFKKIALTVLVGICAALPAHAATLTVSVDDALSNPVPDNTVVFAHNDDYSSYAWELTTSGEATFDLPDDEYTVGVHMIAQDDADTDATAALPETQTLTVPDDTSASFSLVESTNVITGVVKDASGAVVQTDYTGWSSDGGMLFTGETQVSGVFTQTVPAGEFLLTFDSTNSATTFEPTWVRFAQNDGSTVDVGTVQASTVEPETVSTSGVGTLSGRVTDTSANGLNCQAVLGVQLGGDGWFYDTTDSNGDWTTSAEAGKWSVQVVATGFDACADPVTSGSLNTLSDGPIAMLVHPLATELARAALSSPQTTTLADGGAATADFTLTTADSTLSGYVRYATSHSQAGETIDDFDGVIVATASSDETATAYENAVWGWVRNGRFSLTVPESPSGGYTLTAHTMPFGGAYSFVTAGTYTVDPETITPGAVTVGASDTVNNAAIYALPNDATISGQISNWPSDEYFSARVCANNSLGTFVCTVARSSNYSLSVAPGEWAVNTIVPLNDDVVASTPHSATVTTVSGETTTQNMSLTPTAATLSGTVRSPSGSVLADAVVSIANEDGQLVHERTDDAGSFSVRLPTGYYGVFAQPQVSSGYGQSEPYQLRLTSGENESVTLTASSTAIGTVTSATPLPAQQLRLVPTDAQTSMSLSDGALFQFPAYGLVAANDTATVSVTPEATLAHTDVYPILDYGYTVSVRDSAGDELSSLSDGMIVTVPYNADTVAASGVSEADLTLSLYRNGAWEPLRGAVVHTSANTVSAHVQQTGLIAVTATPLQAMADLDFTTPKIENLRVPTENRGDTWARAQWAELPANKIVQVQVWNANLDKQINVYEVDGKARQVTLSDLGANRKFQLRGRTVAAYGNSDWHEWVSFRTTPKNPVNLRIADSRVTKEGVGVTVVQFTQQKGRKKLQAVVKLRNATNGKQIKFRACQLKKKQKYCQKKGLKKVHTVSIKSGKKTQKIRVIIPKEHVDKRLRVHVVSRHKKFKAHKSDPVRSHVFTLDQ